MPRPKVKKYEDDDNSIPLAPSSFININIPKKNSFTHLTDSNLHF